MHLATAKLFVGMGKEMGPEPAVGERQEAPGLAQLDRARGLCQTGDGFAFGERLDCFMAKLSFGQRPNPSPKPPTRRNVRIVLAGAGETSECPRQNVRIDPGETSDTTGDVRYNRQNVRYNRRNVRIDRANR